MTTVKDTGAIVRPPAPSFSEGLTTSDLGRPRYELALRQHKAYCAALERCGLKLIKLEADPDYPDSTFVEDTAVISESLAVLTRPGAASRAGEVEIMRSVLLDLFPALHEIYSPGTLDGGDVCQADSRFFIGISERTNEAGAKQLADLLNTHRYPSTIVDVRNVDGLLHLKSGVAFVGDNRLVVAEVLAAREEFQGYDLIRVDCGEEYAANCVSVNDHLLVAAGFPKLETRMRGLGYQTIALGMSEFQKMDAGLSCLSLRF